MDTPERCEGFIVTLVTTLAPNSVAQAMTIAGIGLRFSSNHASSVCQFSADALFP
jgi:hypothetical protein